MFQGSYVALITPLQNGVLDEPALRRLVDWQIEQGTHGLVPVGTTGESPTLSEAEHQRVIAIVVEAAAGRVPVLAGAGSNNPLEALRLVQFAQKAGADGVLCVAGYYNRPNQDGLYQHFQFLHDNSAIPIVIYNIPPRCIVDIAPETMARLALLPRVVGVKDATLDLARISKERALIDKPFSYLSGEDITALAYNAMGGAGCISATANVAPALCAQLQNACRAGDYQRALVLHEQLLPLHQALFEVPSPAGVKYAAAVLGLCSAEARLPMVAVAPAVQKRIEQALQSVATQYSGSVPASVRSALSIPPQPGW